MTRTLANIRSQYLNVAILAGGQALYLVASVTVMTLSGLVGQTLTTEPALATLPVAAMMIGTVLFTLPASLFMKRFGRRTGFVGGSLVGGAAGGAVCVAGIAWHDFWTFCVGNLLLGLYQGFAMYYRFAAADVASATFRSRAISLVMAGGVIAAFVGPWNARSSWLMLDGLPATSPYAVVAALSLVSALLMLRLRVPEFAEPGSAEPKRRLTRIASQPAFLMAVSGAAIGYAVMIPVMTATPLAMRASGFTVSDAALVMQWHVLGMFAPSFVTGTLISRFGVLSILFSGSALLVGSAGAALSGVTLAHYLAALILLGVGWNFLFIGGSTLLTRTHTVAERGVTQGVNDLAVFALVSVGSLLAGLLLHRLGWATLNVLMIPLALLVAAGVLVLGIMSARGGRATDLGGSRR